MSLREWLGAIVLFACAFVLAWLVVTMLIPLTPLPAMH